LLKTDMQSWTWCDDQVQPAWPLPFLSLQRPD